MNWKLWLCIASGVLVIHIGIVMIWVNFQPRPKLRPRPDAFKARAQTVVDPNTGEKVTIREFTVSTRLVPVDDAEKTEDRTQRTD